MAKLAFLGLGVMGFTMAGHLVAKGHSVTVYNRNPAKAKLWVERYGQTSAPTPAKAAKEADVVMACAGDIPTKETLAAVEILRHAIPSLKIRVLNVEKLIALTRPTDHVHGISDSDFDSLFTTDRPVIFNFHGYPWLIHRLTYHRTNHPNIHVRGYKEKGNINTPLELAMNNQIDRFNLVIDVIDRVPSLGSRAAHLKERMKEAILSHRAYAHKHGMDAPDITDWRWTPPEGRPA